MGSSRSRPAAGGELRADDRLKRSGPLCRNAWPGCLAREPAIGFSFPGAAAKICLAWRLCRVSYVPQPDSRGHLSGARH